MKQGLLLHQWSPFQSSLTPPLATLDSTVTDQGLTARERRQLRNQSRESKAGYSWREEFEERLIKKPKKKPKSRSVDLNLDTLADSGPQWWIVRVSRVRGHETASLIARLLARNYPELEFKVYAPAVQEKRKLKNGTFSVKAKPIFPGCVFLWCVLNKEIHDFIRECDGVGGFVGSKVGNTKRQINRPRPVSADDMEAIFKQAKEEQENFDQAFVEKQQGEDSKLDGDDVVKSLTGSTRTGRSRKMGTLVNGKVTDKKLWKPGSIVRVVSGTFAEFVGNLKKVDRKTGKATVVLNLFGKDSLVDLYLNEIVAVTCDVNS
ncbi:hypothetical protein K2173_000026 [Erythroxylum novogranatense]|uniref:NusG-like N-terminal domain-containing protein n=1 Tax=Erythroxylum novogranatense TaxID=1862640 RepID=A0AAV8SN85_9ROSI|nr:hypothetical protein K2173_000026 [Erythroxylum novogranatense]